MLYRLTVPLQEPGGEMGPTAGLDVDRELVQQATLEDVHGPGRSLGPSPLGDHFLERCDPRPSPLPLQSRRANP
jgi:hypothetical protein